MPTVTVLLASLAIAAVPAAHVQSQETFFQSNGLLHLVQEKGPVGEVVTGVGEVTKGGVRATKDVGRGVVHGTKEVTQGKPVKGAAKLGKGALEGAADVTKGTLKGGAKIGKGVLKGTGCVVTLGNSC